MQTAHSTPRFKPWMAFWFPVVFVVVMWLVWLFQLDSGMTLQQYGVRPKSVEGLWGLLSMPFLHGGWKHLINNSVPMIALGATIYYFYRRVAYSIYLWSWVVPALGVWLIGNPATVHIGASGMVYAFASFIFFSGIFRNHAKLIALSLGVVFFYGYMIWGIFPIEPGISWEGHLAGGLTGLWLAWLYRKVGGPAREVYSWDLEDEEEEDEAMEGVEQVITPRPGVTIRYVYRSNSPPPPNPPTEDQEGEEVP